MPQVSISALQDCVESLLVTMEIHHRALQEQQEQVGSLRQLTDGAGHAVPATTGSPEWEGRLVRVKKELVDVRQLLDIGTQTQSELISAIQAVSLRVSMLNSSSQRQFRFSDPPAPGIPGSPSSCYLGNNRLLVRTVHNLNLLCDSGDLMMTPPLALTGMWESDTTALLFRFLKPGMKFLDIGANIGYFTVLGASIVTQSGRVDAFEPDPVAFQLLEQNTRMNHISHHARLHNTALANSNGPRKFHSFQKNFAAGTLSDLSPEQLAEYREQPTEARVQCRTLDEVYRDDDVVFDVVKLNTEGAEPLVFDGGREFFRRNIHDGTVLALHFNPPAIHGIGRKPADMLDAIRSQGFRVFRRSSAQEVEEVWSNSSIDMWSPGDLLVTRSPFGLR